MEKISNQRRLYHLPDCTKCQIHGLSSSLGKINSRSSIWLASLYIWLHSYSWNFLCRKIWQHQAFHDIYQNFAEHELEKMKLENKTVSWIIQFVYTSLLYSIWMLWLNSWRKGLSFIFRPSENVVLENFDGLSKCVQILTLMGCLQILTIERCESYFRYHAVFNNRKN